MSEVIIDVRHLNKCWPSGLQALKDVNLQIEKGEIFALLGPNGAGKTTLINIICGLVNRSAGQVTVGGHDVLKAYRQAREKIGLVPQEMALSMFDTVWSSLVFSRGLFGKKPDPAYLESLLRELSLHDKRNQQLQTLSGGMKRRMLIAKALAHEPEVLFLDEPTAGVDVELRRDMWRQIRQLRDQGVTIILTTHYLEEAEALADRIGIINRGEILLTEKKQSLMQKLGSKQLILELKTPLETLPPGLSDPGLELLDAGLRLSCRYRDSERGDRVAALLQALHVNGVEVSDVQTRQTSLEEIFINLLEEAA